MSKVLENEELLRIKGAKYADGSPILRFKGVVIPEPEPVKEPQVVVAPMKEVVGAIEKLGMKMEKLKPPVVTDRPENYQFRITSYDDKGKILTCTAVGSTTVEFHVAERDDNGRVVCFHVTESREVKC